MTHEQSAEIMAMVEQHQRECQVANRYWALAAILAIVTLAMLLA